jgi:hypothetical protein
MLNSDLSLSTLGIGNQLLLAHFCKPRPRLGGKAGLCDERMVVVVVVVGVILISNQVVLT